MCEYGGDVNFICVETWLRSDSVSKSTSFRHSDCLATIAFVLHIYLWWHALWRFNHNYVEH